MIQIFSYLSSIGLKVKHIGLNEFEFGAFVITSLDGVKNSFLPIPPDSFAPAILTLCSLYNVNVKNTEGKIDNKTYLKMNFTTDFRFFDYDTSVKIYHDIHKIGSEPEIFEQECLKYEKKDSLLKKKE